MDEFISQSDSDFDIEEFLNKEQPITDPNNLKDTFFSEFLKSYLTLEEPIKLTKLYEAPKIKNTQITEAQFKYFYYSLTQNTYKLENLIEKFNQIILPPVPYTNRNFGQIKFLREYFKKIIRNEKGKCITYYTKIK